MTGQKIEPFVPTTDGADDFAQQPTVADEYEAILLDMADTLEEEVFGEDGLLADEFEGYMPRQGQIDMTRAVGVAFKDEQRLIVEGPTGTGKSLAYSVPAAYYTAVHKKRAIIVTSNIALQEQLTVKDLPLLQEVLPWKFKFGIAKGRSNYVCLDKIHTYGTEENSYGRVEDKKYHLKIIDWAAETKTGDKSELPFEPSDRDWMKFSVGSDECKGSKCNYHGSCFAVQARQRLSDCHIIVTNYHMLFADVKVRGLTGNFVQVLPDRDYLIMDEGHKAADIARDCFGFKITERMCNWAARDLPLDGKKEVREELRHQAQTFFDTLRLFYESDYYHRRIRIENAINYEPLYDVLCQVASNWTRAASLDGSKDRMELYKKRGVRAKRIAESIKQGMEIEGGENFVYFIEEEKRAKGIVYSLQSKPVHIADILAKQLFSRSKSSIVTSATLMVNGSMAYTRKELGLGNCGELAVESPFDWDKQVAMVFQEGLPEPSGRTRGMHMLATARVLGEIIKIAKGRTLALFTSNAAMDTVYKQVKALKLPYTLLKQNDGLSRQRLIELFKSDTHSVLFGVESFWAGIDVPGDALSCVVMDKLPFANLNDPVLDALEEWEGDAFMNHSVPRAVIMLRQGFGRLIRRVDDKGVVVMLDPRVNTKGYGGIFKASVPTTQLHLDFRAPLEALYE